MKRRSKPSTTPLLRKKATPPLESRFVMTVQVRQEWCDFREPQAICRGTRDRPAIELYGKIATDGRLDDGTRTAAKAAQDSVRQLIVAHGESRSFAPFGGAGYADAVGPTTHFPVDSAQVDPWAPQIRETQNRFFSETDAAAAEGVVA
ncbi:MAG: hypothetical protein M3Y18_00080 [Candidatus Eremiobacteraeota bacterium]|nr:hypothetical protein [Candidatus Eremiobacteraeota bacterium]